MSTEKSRHAAPLFHFKPKRALLGTICAIAFAGTPAAAAPAAAHGKTRSALQLKHMEAEHVSKQPFGDIPKGPLQIIISIDQQELHLYSDGTAIADTSIATGVPGHPTPLGVFSIIEKDRYHHSNIYSSAPMPFMERITWSGVALHEGVNLGHPASHGCIRMSHEFAMRLWALTRLGERVIIAHPELQPQDFADPHLFVHKERPTAPAPIVPPPAAPPTAKLLRTAETVDAAKTTDAPREGEKDTADITRDRNAVDPPASTTATAAQSDPIGGNAVDPTASTTAAAAQSDPAGNAVDPPAAAAPQSGKPGASALAEAVDAAPVVAPLAAPDGLPLPPAKPPEIAHASKAPITIFVSRRDKKLYVRQNFSPLFNAPVSIALPDQPLGTHVITAMEYLPDQSSFRWNVVSLPGGPAKAARQPDDERKSSKRAKRQDDGPAKAVFDPPPQTPQQALARVEISQDVIDRISELMVPGSSLIISDQGLGQETGEGTDFIVVTREGDRGDASESLSSRRPHRRVDDPDSRQAQAPRWQSRWQEEWRPYW